MENKNYSKQSDNIAFHKIRKRSHYITLTIYYVVWDTISRQVITAPQTWKTKIRVNKVTILHFIKLEKITLYHTYLLLYCKGHNH